MSYREIIHEAWVFTQDHKRLIYWYGFVPAIFTTTAEIIYLTYQFFAFKKSAFFDNAKNSFLHDVVQFSWNFISKNLNFSIPMIITIAILGIIYLFLPIIAKAAAIQYVARKKNGHKTSLGEGLKYGILRFLPLLEYHAMIKTFGFFTVIFEAAFVLRNLPIEIFNMLLPLFIFIIVIGVILTLLFTYADFYIVIDNEPVFSSIRKSMKLVIFHWQKTFFITLLMIIIGVRIILQILLLLLIPALILFVGGYIATLTLATVGFVIGALLGLIALFFASYLTGVVDVFSYAVWTFTFLELTSEKEVHARSKAEIAPPATDQAS